jgi:5-formyltetrahydrofolate cyclo-ligase
VQDVEFETRAVTPSEDAAEQEQAKLELRRALRGRCRSLALEARDRASRAAEARLLALAEVRGARTVALYAATFDEADPTGALPVLLERGIRAVFPRVIGPDLEFVPVTDPAALQAGHRGIREPAGPPVDAAEIDVMVVPGLAFDTDGMRLGRGGGHYDRTLPRLRPDAIRVAFCFDFQVVPHVPRAAHDQHVDVIVTDRRVIRTSGGQPLAET